MASPEEKKGWYEKFVDKAKTLELSSVYPLIEQVKKAEEAEAIAEETQEPIPKEAHKQAVGKLEQMIGELTLTDEELDKVLNNFEFRIDKEKDVPSEKAFEFVKGRFERKFRLLSNRIERAITEGFGSYIKQVRKGKGLSLQTVADLTGISPSYINRIEKSERKAPSYRIIEKLAKAFEVPIEEMLKIAGIKEDTTKVQGFAQVIYSNGFTINGRLIPNKQKEMIVEIITKMDEAVWGNDTKYRESIELMELINKYKELDK